MATTTHTSEYAEYRRLLASGAMQEAAALAERMSLVKDPAFWLTQRSIALLRAGKHAPALESAESALAAAPQNQYALLARADARMASGKVTEAMSDYEEAARSRAERVASRGRRGMLECLARTREWERLLALADAMPGDPSERLRWRARALAGLHRRAEAIAACEELLRVRPEDPHALWELTNLQVAEEGVEPVLARMSRLAKIPGKPPVYREICASLSRKAGNADAAVAQYAALASGAAAPRAVRQQAFALAKSGREGEALPLMEELLRLTPHDMYIHSAYHAACKRIGRLERAWAFYHELIRLHPDAKELYGRLRGVQKSLRTASPPAE